jgi:hypothetical protein
MILAGNVLQNMTGVKLREQWISGWVFAGMVDFSGDGRAVPVIQSPY